jgi:hypothetical protein
VDPRRRPTMTTKEGLEAMSKGAVHGVRLWRSRLLAGAEADHRSL